MSGFNMPYKGGPSGLSERNRDPKWRTGKRDPYFNSRVLRGNKAGKGKGKGKGAGLFDFVKPNIGFDPAKMAQTLTDLGYDSDISAIKQSIADNKNNMAKALRELQAWAAGTETQRAAGVDAINAAGAAAATQQRADDANITNLFGGQAAGEAAQGMRPGEDIISATNAANSAFLTGLGPVLSMASNERQRQTTSDFMQKQSDLEAELRAKQTEKNQAYSQNYMDALQLAWGREKDLHDRQLADQAAATANEAAKAALAGQKANTQGQNIANKTAAAQYREWLKNAGSRSREEAQKLAAGEMDAKRNAAALKAANLANQAARTNLKKLKAANNGTIDYTNPANVQKAASVAATPYLGPNGFKTNPRLAWAGMLDALKVTPGAFQNPKVMQTMWNMFKAALSLAHSHNQWMRYYIDGDVLAHRGPERTKKDFKNKGNQNNNQAGD